jgi:hypothetical protein
MHFMSQNEVAWRRDVGVRHPATSPLRWTRADVQRGEAYWLRHRGQRDSFVKLDVADPG